MDIRVTQLDTFFKLYAERFNKALNDERPDVEGVMNSFADCFIEAGPSGVICGKNDESFKVAIPKGYLFYRNIGIKSMDIISLNTSILDNLHEMTKVKWSSLFVKKDHTSGSIEFDIFYFTQTKNNEHKIFAYITGDETATLKQTGLI